MFEELSTFLLRAIAYPIEFFDTIIEATDTVAYIITAFIIVSLVRFIFLPILGMSIIGSDRARLERPERYDSRRYTRRDKYYNPFPTRNDKSFHREWRD